MNWATSTHSKRQPRRLEPDPRNDHEDSARRREAEIFRTILADLATVANVHMVSLRQTIMPAALLGRVNASFRFVSWGIMPFGALLGGYLGDRIGLRATLLVVVAAFLIAPLWIFLTGVHRVRTLEDLVPDTAELMEPA